MCPTKAPRRPVRPWSPGTPIGPYNNNRNLTCSTIHLYKCLQGLLTHQPCQLLPEDQVFPYRQFTLYRACLARQTTSSIPGGPVCPELLCRLQHQFDPSLQEVQVVLEDQVHQYHPVEMKSLSLHNNLKRKWKTYSISILSCMSLGSLSTSFTLTIDNITTSLNTGTSSTTQSTFLPSHPEDPLVPCHQVVPVNPTQSGITTCHSPDSTKKLTCWPLSPLLPVFPVSPLDPYRPIQYNVLIKSDVKHCTNTLLTVAPWVPPAPWEPWSPSRP